VSLRVDDRSQRSSCFQAGTSVGRANRLANSVQPHFFDSGSAAAAGGQERAGQTLFARLATGGRKVEKFDSNGCAHGAREAGRRRRCIAIDRRSAPRRRRARETALRQRKCAVSAFGVEEKVIARESSQGQVRRRIAFVWRRERSGHARVCAGHAGR
jgi:hypothetical protein